MKIWREFKISSKNAMPTPTIAETPKSAVLFEASQAGLGLEETTNLRRLIRSIDANAGRWGVFFLVTNNEPEADKISGIIGRLMARMAPQEIKAGGSCWMDFEGDLQKKSVSSGLIMVRKMDEWLSPPSLPASTRNRRLMDMNIRRESLSKNAPSPLLFFVNKDTLREIANHAIDLYSWRGGIYEFQQTDTPSQRDELSDEDPAKDARPKP